MNRRRRFYNFILAFALIFGVTVALVRAQSSLPFVKPPRTADEPTFNKDIAPIIFQTCAACHHPGGAAPFSLLSFAEVKKHLQQIIAVTQRRYMPPWLPEKGYGEFVGERRLSNQEIALIKQWSAQGAAEGAASDLPPAPRFNDGWQIGQPDLIIKMPKAYPLAASGSDVFRNFVIPVPVEKTRYVKAIEILPGNPKIVHHANLLVDRTQAARKLDQQDGEIGFAGMDVRVESETFEPDSHFLFWKPGTPPTIEPDDMAWRVDKGTDLILNMHLQPSGKPEKIQATIGLYFTDKAPTRMPMLLQLEHDGAIDIPAGKKNFLVSDNFTLPVDVDVLGLYPHAHYLGKELQGFAILPDGTKKWLIRINDWDINWQAVYRFVAPVFLPKGTVISMRYTYDNSGDNPRNPHHPPRRVVAGDRSTDEMGHLWIQVLPRPADDARMILQAALMRQRLAKYPTEFTAHFNLGSVLLAQGKPEEAREHFRAALQARPDDATAHHNLGAAWQSIGKPEAAIKEYQEALRLRPDYADSHYNLANLLLEGNASAAASHFSAVIKINPADANAHNGLGKALAMQGDLAAATAEFEQAVGLDTENEEAHYNLGKALAIQGKLDEAAKYFAQTLRLNPQHADAHNDLGKVLAIHGNWAQAIAHFEQAVRLNPNHQEAANNLRLAKSKLKD